jgi:DNA (cytosine-5)-methyltransferase 1
MQLVLSIFPGIDLLGRAFEQEGFCIVRGPDLIYGGDIRTFHSPPKRFDGIIGGSPCQDFSRARRGEPSGMGEELLAEYIRVVEESNAAWFLLENVPAVPDVFIAGYGDVQRIDIDGRECGCTQRRLRHFQFGSKFDRPLVVDRERSSVTDQAAAMATEGKRQGRRNWKDFCELQGLPELELPGMSIAAKYAAVGNGVPVQMGRLLARSIDHFTRGPLFTGDAPKICGCGCARRVSDRQTFALPCCRKRMQRRRDSAGVDRRRPVTAPV